MPPDANLAPEGLEHLTPGERVAAFFEWMAVCDEFLIAGLRYKIGPDGDLQEALREWYRQDREEHDKTVAHTIGELYRREREWKERETRKREANGG